MARLQSRHILWISNRLRDDLQAANQHLANGDARAQAVESIYRWANALSAEVKSFDRNQFLTNCGLSSTNAEYEITGIGPAHIAYRRKNQP